VATPGLTADPFVIGAGFLAGGITVSVWNVITVSLRQRVTPTRLLGRLNSAYRLLAWGTMPLGAAVGGLLGQLFGVRWVFLIMGVLVVLLVIPMAWVTDRRMEEAEAAVEAEEAAADR
jgi:MFS family permease